MQGGVVRCARVRRGCLAVPGSGWGSWVFMGCMDKCRPCGTAGVELWVGGWMVGGGVYHRVRSILFLGGSLN